MCLDLISLAVAMSPFSLSGVWPPPTKFPIDPIWNRMDMRMGREGTWKNQWGT